MTLYESTRTPSAPVNSAAGPPGPVVSVADSRGSATVAEWPPQPSGAAAEAPSSRAREPIEEPRPARRRTLPWPVWLVVLGCGLGPSCAYLLTWLDQWVWPAELLVHFRPQLLVLQLPGALLVLLRVYRPWAWFPLAATLLCAVEVLSVYLPASQPPPGETSLRIMVANVYHGNVQMGGLVDQVHHFNPDVLVVLEHTHRWRDAIAQLREVFPHNTVEPPFRLHGLAVYSRHPLSEMQLVSLPSTDSFAPGMWITVEVDGRPLDVLATHALSPRSPDRVQSRNRQLQILADEINGRSGPRLLVGDLNVSNWSSHFKRLLAETPLRNSRQGFGILPTWHAEYWPMRTPIDHVLASGEFHVKNVQLGSAIGSDHLPLVVDLSW